MELIADDVMAFKLGIVMKCSLYLCVCACACARARVCACVRVMSVCVSVYCSYD